MANVLAEIVGRIGTWLGFDGTAFRNIKVDAAGELQIDVLTSALPTGGTTEATLATLATEAKLELVRLLLVSLASEDFATQVTLAAVLTELKLKANLLETQPVSAVTLPLPTGAATSANQVLIITPLDLLADLRGALTSVGTDTLRVTGEGQIPAIKDTLEIFVSGLPSGAGGYLTSEAVPGDEIWVITHIIVVDKTTALTTVSFRRVSTAVVYWFGVTVQAIAIGERVEWKGWQWAFAGDTIRVYMDGSLAGDTCNVYLTGYKMGKAGYEPPGYLMLGCSYDDKYLVLGDEAASLFSPYFSSDGSKLYIAGTGGGKIFQYNLTAAWDVTTATYSSISFDITGEMVTPVGLVFSADGTHMYVNGDTTRGVFQYDLSSAWNLGTAVYSTYTFDVSTQIVDAQGIDISVDGTKLYVLCRSNEYVYQYTFATPWDLDTLSYSGKSYSYAASMRTAYTPRFSADGVTMCISQDTPGAIYEFTLSTPWDVSSAAYAGRSCDISAHTSQPSGWCYGNYGRNFYVIAYYVDTIYQYSLPEA